MAKDKTLFVCNECGGQVQKWQGQCPHCLAWNTLSEQVVEALPASARHASLAGSGMLTRLASIEAKDVPRIPTGLSEFDRVLGGGLVRGGVVLLGGDPGIGKSTLLLQALAHLAKQLPVLYVSGEESAQQIALRAQRLELGQTDMPLLPETRLETVLATLETEKPTIAVIDSIQTVYTEQLTSAPGSVAQVRECAQALTRYAKRSGTTLVLVGHVTKEGTLAGPRVLEHIVDTVLYFEGDSGSSFRMVRAFKNRFGAVNELGVFAMTEKGLKAVNNPSALFLNRSEREVPGSCVVVAQEGTRPLLVEIQALVDEAHTPSARRLTVGLDQNRLAMLLAVLHRHGGIACYDQDVFVNAVGGVRVLEPAADLVVLMCIVSSLRSKPLPHTMAVFGEVGLGGEIRPVQRGQERLKEAVKLGFTRILLPKANLPKQAIAGVSLHGVAHLGEALDFLRGL